MRKKKVDPIPEEFASYEEAAEFWDTHDTTDYPEAFRTVAAVTKFRRRYYEIEIDADIAQTLRARARKKTRRSVDLPATSCGSNLKAQLGERFFLAERACL